MKLIDILNEVIRTQEFDNEVDRLKKDGYVKIAGGQGNYGVVLQKKGVEGVKKVTTDSLEISHAIELEGKEYEHIIPILNVVKHSDNLATIDMPHASKLSSKEEEMISKAGLAAQDYIVDDEEEALERIPKLLRPLVVGIKQAFNDLKIDTDEIDWSPSNIMKYKENYVLVDV